MRRFLPAAVLVAVFGLATTSVGCGGCKGNGGDQGVDVPKGPYGDVLKELCKTLDRCPEGFGYPIAYRNRSECAAILNFTLTCRLTEQEIGDDTTIYGVRKITPEMDEEQAQECIQWLKSSECGDLNRTGEAGPCSDVFQLADDDDENDAGSADVDEPCSYDDDCLQHLYCIPQETNPDTGEVYCQVCKPRLGAGEECTQNGRDCKEGLYCRFYEDEPRKCAELDPDETRCLENEQCRSGFCDQSRDAVAGWGYCASDGNEGDDCQVDTSETPGPGCRQEFFCDDGTCVARLPNGEPCTDHNQCANTSCHEETGICGLPDGEACGNHDQCAGRICKEGVCGGAEGECTDDEQCPDGEFCSGICRPPSCGCSGESCPIGTCTPEGQGGSGGEDCSDDEDCGFGECQDGVCVAGNAIGEACEDSYECYPYGYCSGGTCVERHDPGADCTALDSCKEPFLCVDGKCEIMNLRCEPASAGERCAFLRVCDENSYCDLFDGVTCKPRSNLGESCSTSRIRGVETCVEGTFCNSDDQGGTTCVARPGVGEPCSGTCVEGAYCFEGECRADPVGRPCGYDGPCPDGLVCNSEEEVCLPPGGEGASCDETRECAEEFFCENYSTCQPRKGSGQDCDDTSECQPHLYCDDGICSNDLEFGEMCDDRDASCAEGYFCPRFGTEETCQQQRPPGADCDDNRECLSGVCFSSTWCQSGSTCKIPE